MTSAEMEGGQWTSIAVVHLTPILFFSTYLWRGEAQNNSVKRRVGATGTMREPHCSISEKVELKWKDPIFKNNQQPKPFNSGKVSRSKLASFHCVRQNKHIKRSKNPRCRAHFFANHFCHPPSPGQPYYEIHKYTVVLQMTITMMMAMMIPSFSSIFGLPLPRPTYFAKQRTARQTAFCRLRIRLLGSSSITSMRTRSQPI